jgi:hypothetical protein
MKYINEVKSEDLPADQILGYVCELAVEDTVLNRGATIVLSPKSIISFFETRHKIIFKKLLKSTQNYVINVGKFYNQALSATNTAFEYEIGICENDTIVKKPIRQIVGNKLLSSAAGSTSPYDVVTDTAYLHVKLNQSSIGERLIGFQGNINDLSKHTVEELRDIKGTVFGNVYNSKLNSIFGKGGPGYAELQRNIIAELKKDLVRETPKILSQMSDILLKETITEGKLLKPGDAVRKVQQPYVYHSSLTLEKKSYDFEVDWDVWWPFIKENYKSIFKKYFNNIVNSKTDQVMLLNDIKAKIVGEPTQTAKGRVVLFLNYEGEIDNLKLVINKYQVQSCGATNVGEIKLDWINEGKKQPYGLIWIKNEDFSAPGKNNVLYYIEIRTDGEGHPPQLKIGGALKSETFMNVFIYKAAQKNEPTKPIVVSGAKNLLENFLNMLLV